MQYLSRDCPMCMGSSTWLYNIWTNIWHGQTLDKHLISLNTNWWHCNLVHLIGQSLDKYWIARPISVHNSLNWTDALQTLDKHCTYLDRPCTFMFIGQTFDRVWTEFGFCVQSLSNQPMITSTKFLNEILPLRVRWRFLQIWSSISSAIGILSSRDVALRVAKQACIYGAKSRLSKFHIIREFGR